MHFVSRATTTVEKEEDSIARLEQARAQILACYMRNKPDPEFDRVMAAYYDELEEQADNIHSSQRLPVSAPPVALIYLFC